MRASSVDKRATIQELNDMLAEFNLQRSSVEINRNTTLWSHNSDGTKSIWTPVQATLSSNYGMPQSTTSAERRPGPERSLKEQYSKWSGNYNISHEPALPTTSLYSVWADHNTSKPPPERSPDTKGPRGVGTDVMRKTRRSLFLRSSKKVNLPSSKKMAERC